VFRAKDKSRRRESTLPVGAYLSSKLMPSVCQNPCAHI
jgi:hypothetical protein